MQQAGHHSELHQEITYGEEQMRDIRATLETIESHLGELRLDVAQENSARAQITTLRGQLMADPNPTILKLAGKTLQKIIVNATASVVATGALSIDWHGAINSLAALL